MDTTTDRSTAYARLARRHPHLVMTALMGTAKHLREAHGVEHPPTDRRELAQAHVDAHGGIDVFRWPTDLTGRPMPGRPEPADGDTTDRRE